MLKESVVGLHEGSILTFRGYSNILAQREDNQLRNWDVNPGPREYKSGLVPTGPCFSVCYCWRHGYITIDVTRRLKGPAGTIWGVSTIYGTLADISWEPQLKTTQLLEIIRFSARNNYLDIKRGFELWQLHAKGQETTCTSHSSFTYRCTFISTLIIIYIKLYGSYMFRSTTIITELAIEPG